MNTRAREGEIVGGKGHAWMVVKHAARWRPFPVGELRRGEDKEEGLPQASIYCSGGSSVTKWSLLVTTDLI